MKTKPATKRNPTSSPAKTIDAGLQVEPQKGSGASVPASRSAEFPLLAPLFDLALDPHQTRMVGFLAERLGGTTAEVLEFLVSAGLYVMQLDEWAEGRVAGALDVVFEGTEIPTGVMNQLRDLTTSTKFEVDKVLNMRYRPRMMGDWRGATVPEQAEA